MKNLFFLIFVFFISTSIQALEFKGTFYQGNLIIGKTEPTSNVYIDKKRVKVSDQGFFAFGLNKNRKTDVIVEVFKNGATEKVTKKVYKKVYKIQKINGLPKKQVTPPKEFYERIKADNKLIAKARSINTNLIFFSNVFEKPIEKSIITGVYGSQRILNGIPKSPHYGLDFAANEGTEIKAMLDGVVTLSEKNLYYTGGTIIFDHGHGVSTLYMHLQDIYVKNGQSVKQGNVIGTVGKTGRATGAHLDIRLNWFGVKLDPASVLTLD
jgi:murein DD-endopeptidase MepM/ murein hydrolase activator NlpD